MICDYMSGEVYTNPIELFIFRCSMTQTEIVHEVQSQPNYKHSKKPLMKNKIQSFSSFTAGVFLLGCFFTACSQSPASQVSETSGQIYELRIYTANEGKLEKLHQRFRDHTFELFEKHGMKNIGYWVPQDPETAENTLIYVISHESREAAANNWASFSADPDWQEAREASHADGIIVDNVESIFMDAVDYSPLK